MVRIEPYSLVRNAIPPFALLLAALVGYSIVNYPIGFFNPGILAVLGAAAGIIVLLRPALGVYILFVAIWLSPLYPILSGDDIFTVNRSVGTLLLITVILRRINYRDKHRFIFTRFDNLLWIYFLWAFLTMMVTGISARGQGNFTTVIVSYLSLWLTVNVIQDWKTFQTLLLLLLIGTIVLAVPVLTQAQNAEDVTRFSGIGFVNFVGPAMILAMYLALWIINTTDHPLKHLLYIPIPLFLIAYFLTGNRSGFLFLVSTGIVLLFMLPYSPITKARIFGISLAATIFSLSIVGVLAPQSLERGLNNIFPQFQIILGERVEQEEDIRANITAGAIRMFADYPITGVGFGNFSRNSLVYVEGLAKPVPEHNIFTSVLAETGIVGFTLVILIYRNILFHLWRLWRETPHKRHKIAASFAFAMTIGYNMVNASVRHDYFLREMFLMFTIAMVTALLIERDLKAERLASQRKEEITQYHAS